MGKNKLDIINFSKIYDMFGEDAAKDTLNDVNSGRVSEKTLEKYLESAGYDPKRIAVERNGAILPKSRYSETILSDGDEIEIVSFVGGG